MGNTRNFTFTFMVLAVLVVMATMSTRTVAPQSTALSRQDARIEMTVKNAVTSQTNVSDEQKKVILQILDTSSDN